MTLDRLVALFCWTIAGVVDFIGLRLIVRGAGADGHPDQSRMVVRGFRRLILGGGLICFGLGFWFDNHLLHLIGVVFLLEEAVETGLMMTVLKRKGPS
jgi:hypothetical protein